ncbi:hypothetical protein [Helicobacter rodentium]|uniref:hypothetical protein n=1 Tax=Helicobacter rodentium TaxID=59617 RepID=UPI0004796F9C|nr:hypothetical protein [Helicobacter rodentium]
MMRMTSIGGVDNIVSKKTYLSANARAESSLQREAEQDSLAPQEIKESIKAKLVGQDSNYKLVLFDDATSGERVSALLSKENLERLQEKFNQKDFYARDDGLMRLSGKAEAYVSGWYAQIVAGEVGAQKADLDRDGKFSDKERGLIQDGYTFKLAEKGILNNGMAVYSVATNAKADDTKVRTIEDLLDNFITQDKNLDGEISVQEHIEVTRGNLAQTLKGILKSKENTLAQMVEDSRAKTPEPKSKEELDVAAMEEAMRLLAKIKQSGNLNTLSAEEQALVQQYFAGEVELIKQQSNDADVINGHLTNKINDFVEQMRSNESLILSVKA